MDKKALGLAGDGEFGGLTPPAQRVTVALALRTRERKVCESP